MPRGRAPPGGIVHDGRHMQLWERAACRYLHQLDIPNDTLRRLFCKNDRAIQRALTNQTTRGAQRDFGNDDRHVPAYLRQDDGEDLEVFRARIERRAGQAQERARLRQAGEDSPPESVRSSPEPAQAVPQDDGEEPDVAEGADQLLSLGPVPTVRAASPLDDQRVSPAVGRSTFAPTSARIPDSDDDSDFVSHNAFSPPKRGRGSDEVKDGPRESPTNARQISRRGIRRAAQSMGDIMMDVDKEETFPYFSPPPSPPPGRPALPMTARMHGATLSPSQLRFVAAIAPRQGSSSLGHGTISQAPLRQCSTANVQGNTEELHNWLQNIGLMHQSLVLEQLGFHCLRDVKDAAAFSHEIQARIMATLEERGMTKLETWRFQDGLQSLRAACD